MYRAGLLHVPEEYKEVLIDKFKVLNPAWEYAVRTENRVLPEKHLHFYELLEGYVRVPRMFADESLPEPEDRMIWQNPAQIKFKGNLFPAQKQALDEIDKNAGNVILEMPTGSGKTIVGIAMAALYSRRTLILTHKKVLAQQWDNQFREFTNQKPYQLSHTRENYLLLPDVVIAMAQTIHYRKEQLRKGRFFDMFDVVIVDECHRFSAMSFHQAISRFAGRIRLGLTATAFRNDGLDFVFQTSIGKTIHIEADKTHMPIVVVRHTAYDRNSSHKASYSTAITHLTRVKPRNQLIADDALFCLKNGRKILLLSDRLFQLRHFFDKICRHYPADKVCLLTGSDTLNISPYDADIVLATYGVAKEGIDIPALDTMMYASPISDRISITQSVGRLLRGKKEKEILIFDYLDSNSLGRALYNKRRDIYQELNLNDIRHKRGELDSAETV